MSARSFRQRPTSLLDRRAATATALAGHRRHTGLELRGDGASPARRARNDRRHGHAPRAQRAGHPAQHRRVRRLAARSARDQRSRGARPQRAGPLRHRPRQAFVEQHRRARLEPEPVPVGRVPRQLGRRHGLDLCRRGAAVRRPESQRHRASRGACSARRARCTAPARSAARSATFRASREFDDTSVECARHHLLVRAESDSMGWRGGATFNVPFGDNLALRASIDRYDDPGFIDTPYLVRQAGVSDPEPNFPAAASRRICIAIETSTTEETTSARVALRWQPGDNVDATFTYHYQNMDVGGRTQNHRLAFGTGLYESATRYPEPNERTQRAAVGRDRRRPGLRRADLGHGLVEVRRDVGQRDQTDLLDHARVQLRGVPDVLGVHARDRAGGNLLAGDPARLEGHRQGRTGSAACSSKTSSSPTASAASSRRSTTRTSAARAPTTSSTSASCTKI